MARTLRLKLALTVATLATLASMVPACVGEGPGIATGAPQDGGEASPEAATGGDGGGGDGDGGVDGDAAPPGPTCAVDPDNLVDNGSFENGPAGWGGNAGVTLSERTDGPYDCSSYLEVATTEPWSGVAQGLHLETLAVDAGVVDGGDGGAPVTLEFGAFVKTLDDDTSTVNVTLRNDDDRDEQIATSRVLDRAGAWQEVKSTITVAPRRGFVISIGSQPVRKFAVDRVWVRVRK